MARRFLSPSPGPNPRTHRTIDPGALTISAASAPCRCVVSAPEGMMKIKIKHLRHPFQTIATAKVLAKTYVDVKLFPYRSRLHFRGDSRYELQNVRSGLASRIDNSSDDQELLERICTAYIKAVERQPTAREAYQPSEWWRQVRQTRLQPVMQALEKRDLQVLRRM